MRFTFNPMRLLMPGAAVARVAPALLLAAALFLPTMAHAGPILGSRDAGYWGIAGWENEFGTFELGGVPGAQSMIGGVSLETYSTESSRLSIRGGTISLVSPFSFPAPVDMRIDAIIGGNGSISGDLVSGSLVIVAGVNGIPEIGMSAGDTILVAEAIDAAALVGAPDTALLFKIMYGSPLITGLLDGYYLTYINPMASRWGTYYECPPDRSCERPYRPWAIDFVNTSTYDFFDLVPTKLIPEPSTWALVSAALVGLGCVRRRRAM